MKNSNKDTIAAISTALGEGGIGIVRLSGEDSLKIAEEVFSSGKGKLLSRAASHTIHRGFIKDPVTREAVDEVLVSVMRAPSTYTAEDVVEINCHGGTQPLKRILKICLLKGARLAEPGEFTKRAFINGRIDLLQAEAVLDIITSQTEASCRIAVRQLKGSFSREVASLRDKVLEVLAKIELSIDFSEEDVEFPDAKAVAEGINEIHQELRSLIATSEKGMIIRDGASVVICGRPNVGKSSLMNALLKHERVIVTPIAGTTRDVIEESIIISGVKVKLTDTAGIIETRDRVELEGIKRSKEKLEGADIVVFMLDSSLPFSRKDKEIFDAVKDKDVVVVANKSDLSHILDIKDASKELGEPIIEVSVLNKEGLERLEDAISDKLFHGEAHLPEGPIVANMRHKELLLKAYEAVNRCGQFAETGYNGELLASDLNEAVFHLGLITGESCEDEILDRIFSKFCIGK